MIRRKKHIKYTNILFFSQTYKYIYIYVCISRRQLAIEKFKSEINLERKRSEKYQERFMKINAEMITHLKGHFENNKVCDALIKKWKTDFTKEEEKSIQIFNKKEDFFLNNSSSE